MSAELQLWPLLRLPSIKIRIARSPDADSIPPPFHPRHDVPCQTPTSPDHKIPAILSCPPAPKKTRPAASVNCKRKLEFFEISGRDEIESFFKESFESIDGNKKRRC